MPTRILQGISKTRSAGRSSSPAASAAADDPGLEAEDTSPLLGAVGQLFACGGHCGGGKVFPNMTVPKRKSPTMASQPSVHRDRFSGLLVEHGDKSWHYCVVFKRVQKPGEVVRKPYKVLKACFSKTILFEWENEEEELWTKISKPTMDKGEFYNAVWDKVVELLQGDRCGFNLGTRLSIDKDEVFLMMQLEDKDRVGMLADTLEMMKPFSHGVYDWKGIQCPRVEKTWGQIMGLNRTRPAFAPAYIRFELERKVMFERSRDAAVKRAADAINSLVNDFDKERAEFHVRSDSRMVVMAALVYQIKAAQTQAGTLFHTPGTGNTRLAKLQPILAAMSEQIEQEDEEPIEQEDKASLTPQKLFDKRVERWSSPSFEELSEVELYEEFNDLDVLRIVYKRLAEYVDIGEMQEQGIVSAFFPMHKHDRLQELDKDWSSLHPLNLIQFPGDQHNDMVRDYFGEEVAFFFSWVCFETRKLLFPAFLALFCCLRQVPWIHETWSLHSLTGGYQMFEDLFAVLMVGWVSYLTASYSQFSHTKNLVWGMKPEQVKGVRLASFEHKKRGTMKVRLIRGFHWFVVFAFVVQTVWMATKISQFRAHMLKMIEDESIALASKHFDIFGWEVDFHFAQTAGNYAITLNIKIMSLIWNFVSPCLARNENRYSDLELKNSQVSKNFAVMCVVYYYPFFYLAFFKDYVEGCHGDSCIEELEVNLVMYFAIHIATVVGTILFQLAYKCWVQREEAQKTARESQTLLEDFVYTDAEEQAKRTPYMGDSGDYLELTISLGFIAMFSVVMPTVAVLALVSNLIEVRVLAWRMTHVMRRPVPREQEGIGAWLWIMQGLSFLSGVTCVALCIFALEPLKSRKQLRLSDKMILFIVAEHVMMGLIFSIQQMIPHKSAADLVILEQQEQDQIAMLRSERTPCEVPAGKWLHMGDTWAKPGSVAETPSGTKSAA